MTQPPSPTAAAAAASRPVSDPSGGGQQAPTTTTTTQKDQEKPVPRPPKSLAHRTKVLAQNRRREYLLRNPKYLNNIDHELADPVLYERLVRRHQSPAEREAEGKAKGYGRTLEADLVRGETKLSSLRDPTTGAAAETSSSSSSAAVDEEWHQPAESKAHGLELWRLFLTDRFIQRRDDEFDYAAVDDNDEYDGLARMDAQEQWFDEEEPSRAGEEEHLQGETGVQDF